MSSPGVPLVLSLMGTSFLLILLSYFIDLSVGDAESSAQRIIKAGIKLIFWITALLMLLILPAANYHLILAENASAAGDQFPDSVVTGLQNNSETYMYVLYSVFGIFIFLLVLYIFAAGMEVMRRAAK